MLALSHATLPQSSLTYLAFRLAFRETLERIALADQFGCDPHESFGFLTEVPFLKAVPAHVQLDLLAATWAKHVSSDRVQATLLDAAILYAACETGANLIEADPEIVPDFLRGGPLQLDLPVTIELADSLRELHLNLAGDGEFLVLSQFEDLAPRHAAPLKLRYNLTPERIQPLFDVLTRWYLTPEFLGSLTGLLTKHEVLKTVRILGVR